MEDEWKNDTTLSLWERIRKYLRTFLSTPSEWHSFVIGWCEVMCPWKPRFFFRQEYIAKEYPYYLFGRVIGFLNLLGIGLFIFKEVS